MMQNQMCDLQGRVQGREGAGVGVRGGGLSRHGYSPLIIKKNICIYFQFF